MVQCINFIIRLCLLWFYTLNQWSSFLEKLVEKQALTMQEDENSSRQMKNMTVGSKYSTACSHHSNYSLMDNSNQ